MVLPSISIKKEFIPGLIFSIIFGIVLSVSIPLKNDVLGVDFKYFLVGFVGSLIVLHLIVKLINKCIESDTADFGSLPVSFKQLWIIFLVIYGICLITYFPGVGMNDGLNIMKFGMSQVQQFPVAYCIFIGILTLIGYHFGSLQISIALYSAIQVLVTAFLTAYLCHWINQKRVPKGIKIFAFMYFACMPIFAMYAVSMLKDTLFSLAIVILCVKSYDLVFDKDEVSWKSWSMFLFISLLVLTLRTNGKFIVFPLLIALFLIRKAYWKQWITLLCVFTCVLGMINAVMHHYGTKQLFQEAVGIPLQQMCAVVQDGEMNAAEKDFMNHLMPIEAIKTNYNPHTVDPIKWNVNGQFNRKYLESHRAEFIKNWLSMMPKNFGIYVRAYLQQTYWFWAPIQEGQVQCYYSIETFSNNAWLPDFVKKNGIHDQSLMPDPIRSVLQSYYQLARYFFREGVLFWMLLFSAMTLVSIHQKKRLFVYLPLVLLWLTLMVSTPVNASLRYVFAFAYGFPLFVAVPFIRDDHEEISGVNK